MPDDYEPCGECGFDHSYEQSHAVNAHEKLDRLEALKQIRLGGECLHPEHLDGAPIQ